MSIKILTLNTAMLPDIWPVISEPKRVQRANKLIDLIYKENYDIICLQEVFSEEIRGIFFNKLKTKFPFIVKKTGDDVLWIQDSGLFFASMFPFKGKPGNIIFSNNPIGSDGQSEKGFLFAKLVITNDILLYCFSTHLQSSVSNDDVRRYQLREIRNKMLELFLLRSPELKNENMYLMLFGDLNIIGKSPGDATTETEYDKMMDILSYPRDLFRKKNITSAGLTWNGTENTFIKKNDKVDKDKQRLDYAIAFDNVPTGRVDGPPNKIGKIECLSCTVKKFKDDKGNDLSDHYGIETVINI